MPDPAPPPVAPAPAATPSPAPATPAMMRRDIQSMLAFIQGARIVSMAREVEISRFQGWLVERFLVGLAVAGLALVVINVSLNISLFGWWDRATAALLSGLVLITLCSRIGAIVSIGRRMRDESLGVTAGGDSIYTLAAMDAGRNGLMLALVSSNVFGLVTFALFASGVPAVLGLKDGIVPAFKAVEENQARDQAVSAARRAVELRDLAARCKASPTPSAAPSPVAAPAYPNQPAPGSAPAAAPARASQPAVTPTGAASCTELQTQAEAASREATALEKAATDAGIARLRTAVAGGDWLGALRDALGLASIPDLFKLLLWAFIAGFFEQFVPDMLDRIAARNKQTAQSNAATTT